MNKKIFTLLFIIISFSGIYSQVKPGGVGNGSDAVVWLRADKGVVKDASNVVNSWEDQSQYTHTASQSDFNLRPSYIADGGSDFNYKPVLRFNNDFLSIPNNSNLDGFADGVTIFAVVKPVSPTQHMGVVAKCRDFGNQSAYNMYIRDDGDLRIRINNGQADARSSGTGTIGAAPYILCGLYDPAVKRNLASYYNSQKDRTVNFQFNSLGSYTSDLNIGTYTPTNNRNNLTGDIAEIIIFNRGIKNAERLLLENYLSQKYNIALTTDVFGVAAGYNENYLIDYTGIGQENDGTVSGATSSGFYINESGGSLSGREYVAFAHSQNSNTIVRSNVTGSAEERWERDWWVEKTSVDGINVDMIFDFPEGIAGGMFPQNVNNYVLLYRAQDSGDYTQIPANVNIGESDQVVFDLTNTNFKTGYYTIGTIDKKASPLKGSNGIKYYSLKSGDWDDWETWTLDASGALPNNPDKTFPNGITDNVEIKGGKTVTMNLNNIQCLSVNVNGRLDLGLTSGHTFDNISGSGRILMSSDNFPSYTDASSFINVDQDEGTVVYYGNSFSLRNNYSFCNMEVSMNSGQTLTMLGNYTIYKNLTINSGDFQINNNSMRVVTLNVDGDFTVSSGSRVQTGRGNTYLFYQKYHQIFIKGDFVNNGTAHFTNRTAANYTQSDMSGACELIFNKSDGDQAVLCNGETIFNQITCNKGTDATYILDISASSVSNFNLFGRNNEDTSGDDTVGGDRDGNKALRLLAGTMKLGSNIVIPQLAEDSTFDIDADARLWLYANASVSINSADWLAVYGVLQCSDNSTFTENTNAATILRGRGVLKFEGGEHNLNSVRTSTWGGSGDHTGAYIQSGGTVNIVNEVGGYASFHLPFKTNVFSMSGGVLHITDQGNSGDGDDFAMVVNSTDENSNVTGGTVIIDVAQNVGSSYKLNVRPAIWNLNLRNSYTTTYPVQIDAYTATSDDTETMQAMPLRVLNDLNIEGAAYTNSITGSSNAGNTLLECNNTDVQIGHNFNIHEGAIYSGGTNTTMFNGSEDGELYIGYTTANDGYEQSFYNIVLNKPADKTLLLKGDEAKSAQYQQDNGYSDEQSKLVKVENNITIESGILNQGDHSIGLYGTVEVDKNGQCGVYEYGDTHNYATIELKNGNANIATQEGAIFGNLKVNPTSVSGIISFSSDVYVKRLAYFGGRINIAKYNLKVDYLHNQQTTTNYDWQDGDVNTEMIFTKGEASDGGLSLLVNRNGIYGYPIGINGKYTPANLTVTGLTEPGYVTINPVDSELKTTKLAGGDLLDYYWRVGYDSYVNKPTVKYEFEYDPSDANGDVTKYVPGKVLDENPFTRSFEDDVQNVDEASNVIIFKDDNTTVNGSVVSNTNGGFKLEKANYTAGESTRFEGAPTVYYSIVSGIYSGSWHNGNNWARNDNLNPLYENHDSRQNAAGTYPKEGDIAVIGWCPWNDGNADINPGDPHLIRLTRDLNCAQLIFTPMEDVNGNPSPKVHRYATAFRPCLGIYDGIAFSTGLVQGEGMFWCRDSDPDFTLMDIGEFALSDSSYILYENYNDRIYVNMPAVSPNLMISSDGLGTYDRTTVIGTEIKTNGNLEIIGDANVQLDDDADGDIYVGGDLLIYEINNPSIGGNSGGGGEIRFSNTGQARTLKIDGDLILRNTANKIYVQNPGTNNISHQLLVGGNILQSAPGDGLLFYTGNQQDHIDLTLFGDKTTNVDIQDGAVPELNRLIINKDYTQNATADINSEINLNGSTNGNGVAKAIELQSGKLLLNNQYIVTALTTGDDNFKIPVNTCLEIAQGKVFAVNNSGIDLDGELIISGGMLDMRGGNNPIIYSASGNASIQVSDGYLYIGSQIRRDESSTEGVLKYTQTGGVVEIGENGVGVSNRGVFEILNQGSSFTHSGGDFTLVNDLRSNPTIASFYYDPETSNISDGTTINIGNGNTRGIGNDFQIYTASPVSNLTVNNESGYNIKLTNKVVSLKIDGDLSLKFGAELDANGLDLLLKGDFINQGIFTSNNNNTYIEGTSDQEIDFSGVGSFYNFYKTNTNKLSLLSNVTIDNDVQLLKGTFNDGGFGLFAKGDMHLDITTSTTGGDGIIACGTSKQILTGKSDLSVFKMDNQQGVKVPVGNQIAISNELVMNKGILDIDQNLLILKQGAAITEASSFSEDNMIQTNISFTDAGIKKYFNAINTPTIFVYPIGSQGKYTPIDFTINKINQDASIRVKAANEFQPSVQDGLGKMGSGETNNVLQYYWILDSDNAVGVDATIVMQAIEDDERVTSPYTTSQYITARLRSRSSGTWDKYGDALNNDYNEATHELTFILSGDDDQIDGDYTAGIDDAIPDQVAQYVSVKDGDWGDSDTWSPAISNGPRGARVLVKHAVNMETNYKVSYETKIDQGGKLKVNESYGHRLGNVFGTGTLYMESGDLPAGDYVDFFSANGGVVEYGGNKTYDILSAISACNTIIISGNGKRRLPNVELQLYGHLIIGEVTQTDNPVLINEHNQKLNIHKDLVFHNGRYNSKTGNNCTINFNGSTQQEIKGAKGFTQANSSTLYNLQINNPSGLLINNDVEISNELQFGAGIIYTSNTNKVTIVNTAANSVSGVSNSNYVSGPLCKNISAGDQFDFPVGDGGKYGNILVNKVSNNGIWEAQYYNYSAAIDGYDVEKFDGDVEYVSKKEYWRVQAPASGQFANIKFSWDASSGVLPDNYFRVVKWTDLATDAWQSLNVTNISGSSSKGSVDLLNKLAFGFNVSNNNHYLTFGAISIPPFTWVGHTNDWFKEANWSNLTVPKIASNVSILPVQSDKFYPIIDPTINSALVEINDLSIEPGATLTLNEGVYMTVNGNLSTSNGLIINNSPQKPTSLITKGSISGNTTFNWPLTEKQWWYISHSVQGVVEDDYEALFGQNNYAINKWNGGAWQRVAGAGDVYSGKYSFTEPLSGYAVILRNAGQTLKYEGEINNNANYGLSNLDKGNHLIANPYPSYIDVESSGLNLGNFEKTIYIRNSNDQISTYNLQTGNGLLGGSRYISPGQCIWLYTRNSGDAINISSTMRTHANDGLGLKNAKVKQDNKLKLTLKTDFGYDELLIEFRENGSEFYTNYDSKKIMNNGKFPSLYSIKDNMNIAINSKPELFGEDLIPLGYKVANSGVSKFVINAVNINDFNERVDVLLVDKETKETINLRKNPAYEFHPKELNNNKRFELHFKESISTSISDNKTEVLKAKVLIYSNKTLATVRISDDLLLKKNKLINVYNTTGERVNQIEVENAKTIFELPLKNTIYIIEVSIDGDKVRQKVLSL